MNFVSGVITAVVAAATGYCAYKGYQAGNLITGITIEDALAHRDARKMTYTPPTIPVTKENK